jgi:hypothetical protein
MNIKKKFKSSSAVQNFSGDFDPYCKYSEYNIEYVSEKDEQELISDIRSNLGSSFFNNEISHER